MYSQRALWRFILVDNLSGGFLTGSESFVSDKMFIRSQVDSNREKEKQSMQFGGWYRLNLRVLMVSG